MRTLLRVISVIAGLSVVQTAWFVFMFGQQGFHRLLQTGSFGAMTLAGWIITFTAGPIAAVQLWRLRHSGRIAGIVLFASMFGYYFIGILLFRTADASLPTILVVSVVSVAIAVVLLLPAASATCIAAEVAQRLSNT